MQGGGRLASTLNYALVWVEWYEKTTCSVDFTMKMYSKMHPVFTPNVSSTNYITSRCARLSALLLEKAAAGLLRVTAVGYAVFVR